MSNNSKKFYVTTPIYYVNAPPHMGTAYTTVLADTLARFHRMQGADALLVTGSDEHSQNIADKAAAEGLDPEEFCRRFIPHFLEAWKLLDIGPYKFLRTSSPEHRAMVQAFFTRIHERGDIYKAQYSGWYHTTDNRYVDESELPPNPEKDPKLKFLAEDAYWFRLSNYADWLLKWYEEQPEAVIPGFRRNEMLQRIRQGLRDLCISRSSTSWGIPLPWDSEHVFYVWGDALLSYLTGSGFQLDNPEAAGNYWPCDLHIMAKDIPWFHCVIWPALLQSAGVPLFKQALVHGYWNFEGTKMSKSLGNVFHPQDAVVMVGADGVRYFLLREVPMGQDGNFTVKGLAERYNYDLANDFGNLFHRALTMAGRFVGGKIAQFEAGGEFDALETLRRATVEKALPQLAKVEYREALESIWELVRAGNRFVDDTKPWEMAKQADSKSRLEAVFAVLFRSLRTLLVLLAPAMPGACSNYWTQLGLSGAPDSFALLEEPFPADAQLQKPAIVFPKLDLANLEEEFIMRKEQLTGQTVERTDAPAAEAPAAVPAPPAAPVPAEAPATPEWIGYEDFAKVKLITVKVIKAEAVSGSDKLIRMEVDDGRRQDRVIVSGIRAHFAPEHMVGRTICIVDNLKPRKIFGILSEGMILAAGDGQVLRLIAPEGELAAGISLG